MSRELVRPDFEPLIALTEKAARALRTDMLRSAHEAGYTEIGGGHNAVFASLPPEGARAADMAMRAGITRQSMGEVIRDMTRLGIVQTVPDPTDGRAKIVTFTDYGIKIARTGFEHILELEQTFRDEFGDADYEVARKVLLRVREILWPDGFNEPTPASVSPG